MKHLPAIKTAHESHQLSRIGNISFVFIRENSWAKILILLGLFFLTGCGKPTLPEGGFAAKATLSEQQLKIGDITTLTFTARHAAGSVVKFPVPGKGKEVVVRGRSSDTTELAEGILQTEEVYYLTSLRTGNWLITTNLAVCTFSDGSKKAQAFPPLTLNAQSSLDETNINSLSDIKGLAKPPLQISPIIKVVMLIALLALLAGLITLLFIRKAKKSTSAEPDLPAHIKALTALSALKETPWMPEPFFVELSLILRTYLENRFDLNAPESTTEELAGKLNHDDRLTLKDQNTLREFFIQADLVKFARAGAEKDVMRTAFNTVETFVEQTKEADQEEKEAKEASE